MKWAGVKFRTRAAGARSVRRRRQRSSSDATTQRFHGERLGPDAASPDEAPDGPDDASVGVHMSLLAAGLARCIAAGWLTETRVLATMRLDDGAEAGAAGAFFTMAITGGTKKNDTATEKARVGSIRDAFILPPPVNLPGNNADWQARFPYASGSSAHKP
jgi:hypothetical protein